MNLAAFRRLGTSFLFLGAVGLMPLAANAGVLAHRYSLNGDGTDSVGGADGTLKNPGGTAVFSATTLTTNNANATDYLSLPSTVGTGLTGDFSVEVWLTQNGTQTGFTSIFSLSTSTSNFILFNPNRNGGGTTADFQQAGITGGGTGTETNITTSQANFQPFGTERQVTLTYNATTGLASVYNNTTLIGSGNIGPGFNFETATNGAFNGINGGDAFPDPTFNGSTDDFRIYSGTLSASQISALNAAGPNATTAQINVIAAPEPASIMLLLSAATLIARRRRKV